VSYRAGEPLTGFTLILDGDSETVEAILKAAMREMERQFRIDEGRRRRFAPEVHIERLGVGYYRLPVYPVHGEIHMRTGP